MKFLKKAAIFSISLFMLQSYSGYAQGNGSIPEDVFRDLSAVLDTVEVDSSVPNNNSIFPTIDGSAATDALKSKIEYKRDRNTATMTINLMGLDQVKIDEGKESIRMELPTDILAQNGLSGVGNFETQPNDRLIQINGLVQEDNTNFLYINLKNNVNYSVSKNPYGIIISFNKMTPAVPRVVIDAGHGGSDPGAPSKSTGTQEKSLTLRTGLALRDILLAKGYDVVMTRDADFYPTLTDRATLANDMDADVFISIHYNSTTNTGVSGIETFAFISDDNKALANAVHNQLISYTGANNRGVKNGNKLVVLKNTKVPAILVELGFLSNAREAKLVLESNYQSTLVTALAKGIDNYFGR